MLQITIPGVEQWDDQRQEFVETKEQTLVLEHSLVSVSKWESKWCKPFMSKDPKTKEEIIDYVRCMTITQNVNPDVYIYLTNENMEQINKYIEAPMTATWFSDNRQRGGSTEQVTNELIYYWMIALNIPLECQKWHLNRLMTLIRICNIKQQPNKKLGRRDVASRYAAANAARRKRLNTRG